MDATSDDRTSAEPDRDDADEGAYVGRGEPVALRRDAAAM
jgi:hypothetical protein